MATVYGSKVNNVWRAYMTYTVTTTPTQVKVSITSGLNIPNDGYSSTRSFTSTISGTGQTTVSGSISSAKRVGVLTKAIKSVTYTWNRTSTAQTKTIKTVLKGSNESTTSSRSVSITVPALEPATITFKANGGSGTVAAINTYVGVANTIPSNSFTRTGYTFSGWNTASDGSGTAYAVGSTITPTGNITLYAQWKTTYVKPEIQNLLAYRVANASGGTSPTVSSIGKTGFCKFNLVGGANFTVSSVSVQFGTATAKSMTKSGSSYYGYSTVDSIALTSSYTVKITVVVKGTDGISRTYTDSTYISKSVPIFDASNDGNCFAFFGTATDGKTSPTLIINGQLSLGTALSIANGGTGATTAAAARKNLGLGNTSGAVPVANGGTGATTAATARTNLGLVGVETRTLLWTNASPTSNFAAQKVSLSLSGYNFVEVIYRISTSGTQQIIERCEIGSGIRAERFYNPTSTSSTLTNLYRGGDGASTSGYAFGNAYKKVATSTSASTDNSYLIPYKIYGIKVV